MSQIDEKPGVGDHVEQVGTLANDNAQHGIKYESPVETTWTKKEERRLVLKLDVVLIPFAMMLYISAYLDRGNLGNARLMGLEDDVLGGNDTHYSIALAMFYVTYIAFAIPGTLLSKFVLPGTGLGIGCTLWSVGATLVAATKNPAGVYICRLLIGIGEACFGQAVALCFSYWYTKEEYAKRVGLFISAGSLAGAFGGLIAFGVAKIPNPMLEAWKVLFLIEGIPGLILAAALFFLLPSYPEKSRYLNARERTIAVGRLAKESLDEGDTGVDFKALKHALKDWKCYVLSIMYASMNTNLSSIGGFLPTIVKNLGYQNAEAQLYTVPVYAVALAVTVIISSISDRYQTRGVPLCLTYLIGVVGWAILLSVEAATFDESKLRLRYFGVICVAAPAYATIPLQLGWVAANNPSQTQRAVGLGMLNTIGQLGSILGSFSFPSSEGPQFVRGVGVNIAFQGWGAFVALCMSIYYRWENKRRDVKEGGRPVDQSGVDVKNGYDFAKGYRYVP